MLFSSHASAQLGVPSVAGSVTVGNRTMPYRAIFPTNYDPNRAYPLVLFLHGAGESGTDNLAQVNGNIAGLIAATRSDEFASILVAPQTNIGWNGPAPLDLVEQILVEVAGTYEVDLRRQYLTGLSMGGFGTFYMAAERPDLFAAAVPIAGGFSPSLAPNLLHVPLWAFHGDSDSVVPVENTRGIIRALRALGGNPRYTEYPGVPHDSWSVTYQDANRELYPWMFSQMLAVPEPAGALLLMAGLLLSQSRRRLKIG